MPKHVVTEESQPANDTPAGGGRIKTLVMACGLLVTEAALILGWFMFFAGPAPVAAESEMIDMGPVETARITEVRLIEEKLTNDRLGSVYVYPVEVYVHVPEGERGWFDDLVGQFQHEIRAEMTALWRSADPVALQDPRMEVMTGRIESLLRERFEGEPDPELSRIRKVVIVCGTGFRIRG